MKQGIEDQEIFDLNSMDDELMEKLYEASKQALKRKIERGKNWSRVNRWKVTACIFRQSSMLRSVKRFDDYDIDIEVCQSVYQSKYSAWCCLYQYPTGSV